MTPQPLQPPGWAQPRGFANGMAARGTLVFTAGMIGWNARQEFETDDFVEQVRQALCNVLAVVQAAGGEARHLVRLTWFITDRDAYLANQQRLGAAYREVLGRHYPAMSVIAVTALMESRALVEIEGTAVIPAPDGQP
ncbi:RidA family protein (plasmid) [Deinococcus metallilatus]|uniref:Enamine deaminase RidA (YjgF/YER057c/UK114 family) n=1 Tax=Deinococcus metallilatus TaxID=1211322 RepID=A0ABR6MUX6_9DEIO|nr:RidA family protein [Deinococcus metallilatus]MBB5295747.1 enamine deaminase RidA (YjgF/YER057c/UK114 family) [Deinococcus metallilatus]QBY06811.1 RidA family protein [Deinococcus metallilatus]GMA14276.1 enamine deaminase RidA [Deinococcus metallilatus]